MHIPCMFSWESALGRRCKLDLPSCRGCLPLGRLIGVLNEGAELSSVAQSMFFTQRVLAVLWHACRHWRFRIAGDEGSLDGSADSHVRMEWLCWQRPGRAARRRGSQCALETIMSSNLVRTAHLLYLQLSQHLDHHIGCREMSCWQVESPPRVFPALEIACGISAAGVPQSQGIY